MANCPSLGFFPLRRLQMEAATCTRFASPDCAPSSGFFNLVTFLFRFRLLGLVSYRIRPWGLDSQRFPPPCSCHGFHRVLSTSLGSHPLWPDTMPSSKEDSLVSSAVGSPRNSPRKRASSDPIVRSGSRICAPGRSVLDEAGLTVFHRSILSQPLIPSRISPLESRPHISVRPPLVGFASTLFLKLRSLYRVSKNPRIGLSLARTAALLGVCVLSAFTNQGE